MKKKQYGTPEVTLYFLCDLDMMTQVSLGVNEGGIDDEIFLEP